MATQQRPLFVYGTLCSPRRLAWVMADDERNVNTVRQLLRRAVVQGYSRHPVAGGAYPAAIASDKPGSTIEGYVFTPQLERQRRSIDAYESGLYNVATVSATILDDNGQPTAEVVEAEMYVWAGDLGDLQLERDWDLDAYLREE